MNSNRITKRCLATLGAALVFAGLGLPGCGKAEDGLSTTQEKTGARLSEIAKKTDGSWDRLTPEDKDFVLNDMAKGNEASARMLLLGAAGKIGGRPGGPPGGPAGGPPSGR